MMPTCNERRNAAEDGLKPCPICGGPLRRYEDVMADAGYKPKGADLGKLACPRHRDGRHDGEWIFIKSDPYAR